MQSESFRRGEKRKSVREPRIGRLHPERIYRDYVVGKTQFEAHPQRRPAHSRPCSVSDPFRTSLKRADRPRMVRQTAWRPWRRGGPGIVTERHPPIPPLDRKATLKTSPRRISRAIRSSAGGATAPRSSINCPQSGGPAHLDLARGTPAPATAPSADGRCPRCRRGDQEPGVIAAVAVIGGW